MMHPALTAQLKELARGFEGAFYIGALMETCGAERGSGPVELFFRDVKAFPDQQAAIEAATAFLGEDVVWTRPEWTAVQRGNENGLSWVISRIERQNGEFELVRPEVSAQDERWADERDLEINMMDGQSVTRPSRAERRRQAREEAWVKKRIEQIPVPPGEPISETETTNDLFEFAKVLAREKFIHQGEIECSLFIIDTSDHQRTILGVPVDGPEHKQMALAMLREQFRVWRIVRYAWISEAWGTEGTDCPPSEAPDRVEVLIVHACDTAGVSLGTIAEIKRDGTKVTLAPWGKTDEAARMFPLLEPATKH